MPDVVVVTESGIVTVSQGETLVTVYDGRGFKGDPGDSFDQTLNTTDAVEFAGLINNGLTFPTSDGTAGQVIETDGAGVLSFVTPSGSGTVTKTSVVSANGFAGSVATDTTTPAITISTSITGLLKGNGTAISAATSGTDYVVPSGSITGNAATVTTNADLTGVITSVGNATSIASQTGTGTKFVVDTSPTLVTPNIGVATGTSLTLSGDLTVNGTTTTIASTTLAVGDKNIVLASASTTDAGADGGGITLKGATDHTWNWIDATDAWTSSDHINLASGKSFYINGTEVLSAMALGSGISVTATTNANLTGVITSVGNATSIASQTGTGTKFVMDTSPTLITPVLGTPSSGTLTSCTGLPVSTGVSGLGTNVATFLATPTSSNLAAALSDETGTGANVFATSPAITTPTITGLNEVKTAPTISAGVLALNCASGNVFEVSLNAAITSITFSNIPTTGTAFGLSLSFTADGTARTISWPASVKWPSGNAPTLTSTSAKVDIFVLTTWDAGTTWYSMIGGQNL